ncbi:uncharacterized protein LOC124208948 isoform X2 [Daphnia pulex]|uniref:uncharacterized protein LOC124208948 isoform X2 n=1 Tax=Daphnia pulex TaxID=6669 RepID=UPI001EE11822|nr:uncharacterized protein LOC124208948 isoform X2 [Daphnia pulex]
MKASLSIINRLLWLLLLFGSFPGQLTTSVSGASVVSDLWSPKGDSSGQHQHSVSLSHDGKALGASVGNNMPSFDVSLPLNVTTQYGAHAHLVCRVQDVANKSVSWVRKRDGHLLTVDTDTFIGDGRFQVHHPANSDIWTLHLRAVRGSDAGKYECQVSSEPKLSLVYQLNIVVPQVEIRGAPDIYVMAGSGVALHCVISGLIETPPYIFWYHKTERIAGSALEESRMFEGSKEAAALASSGATKYGWSARVTRLGPDSLLAVLNVPPATPDFAGNYSCGPPSLQPASVTLHVLNGEQPAAMQHGKNGGRGVVVQSAWTWWTTAFVTLLLMAATKWMSGCSAMASENCLPLDDEAWTPSSCSALAVDGNLTPNCSTDWAVSPISRGGEPGQATKPLDSFSAAAAAAAGQDVPSRCPMMMMMTTHSARSS